MADPVPTREKGQRSQASTYFYRYLPTLASPEWAQGNAWRAVVRNQPYAMICRETTIANTLADDWCIEPRDSNQRQELKSEIEYYTKLFENHNGLTYENHVEWIGQDLLDLPFGGASEVGRQGDRPDGKVLWFIPLDGATLFPTQNTDYPVGQKVESLAIEPVYFPAHAINRVYLSPRPEINRSGWGMPPPEKIFLALNMLNRGDTYYANLLLDTPEAGILDLGDMERESAEQWVESFRSLLNGIDGWKIPVLYEHTNEVKWIPFNRPPTDLMYDRISLQKASLVAAGYGLTLSDIGVPQGSSGGDTLAGSIRSERKSRKTGLAVFKRKITAYFNNFLPTTLRYRIVAIDDELSVALGRARLANATAWTAMVEGRMFSPKEARLQTIADGLTSIPMPEDLPVEDFDVVTEVNEAVMPKVTAERPGMLGNPVSPSQGGHGESAAGSNGASTTRADFGAMNGMLRNKFDKLANSVTPDRVKKMVKRVAPKLFVEVKAALSELNTEQEISLWADWHEKALSGDVEIDDMVSRAMTELQKTSEDAVNEDDWWTLDFDENEIAVILSLAYLQAMKSAAQDMAWELWRAGYRPDYNIDGVNFRLTNPAVLASLAEQAKSMQPNINTGTKYYLRRILLSAVRDAMTDPANAAKIANGMDIQDLLNDSLFMNQVLQTVQSEMRSLTAYRIESVGGFELGSTEMRARVDMFKRAGLTKKLWDHIGADKPCSFCEQNIKAGYVPMDYEYESAFGRTQFGPAHPHEHCTIKYDRGELYQLALQGKFNVWSGE